MWPSYSEACIKDVSKLLRAGGSLSAYRASSAFPKLIGPKEGSQAYAFEREVEKAFKVRHCIAVNSGTAALHGALLALGVGPGDECIVSPYTFSASAAAILLSGAVPRFCDIDHYNFCATAETIKPHVTKRTKAVVAVHLFGYFQDLTAIKALGFPVVEDACQSVGAVREGQGFAGTVGSAGCYSFNGGKQLPTGEGGALVTNDAKIAEKARTFINHRENFGIRRERSGGEIGVNYRMQELVACIARHGLKELPARNERRRYLVHRLRMGLYGNSAESIPRPGQDHTFYVVPFMPRSDRARFIRRCAKRGLAVQAGYTLPLHHLPAFRKYAKGPLPVVDDVHDRLCLLTTLTPDRPLKYADEAAKIIAEALK